VLSFDASVLNELTAAGDVVFHGVGIDLDCVRPRMGSYLAEIGAGEFLRGTVRHFVLDEEVFRQRRKEELRLYTEYLRPRGFHHYCARVWSHRRGTSFMTILRAGRTARYALRDLEDVNRLQSVIAVGEALHASALGSTHATTKRRSFYHAPGLTAPERVALDVARCGLDAAEVGRILGEGQKAVRQGVVAALVKLRARHATPRRGLTRAVSAAGPQRGVLTARELETLQLLLAGLRDKEIAARLRISCHTVHEYTKRIYTHFAVHSRASLIVQYGRSGRF
jgi:DNA-binding NarL/FixJ family response regulator